MEKCLKLAPFWSVPINFSKMDIKDGKAKIGPAMTIGYGYTWFFGNFTMNENQTINADPKFTFGLAADAGVKQDPESTGKGAEGAFSVGGFLGVKNFSLLASYDFITKSVSFGLGGRFDFFTLNNGSLDVYGHVEPLYPNYKKDKPVPQDQYPK
jgi:hypothetical protein